jgi:hypothetical protein
MITKTTRSLGGLRPNKHKKHQSHPDLLGRILLTRETISDLVEAANQSSINLIEAELTGWFNAKRHKSGHVDQYLTVEIRKLQKPCEPLYKPTLDEDPIPSLEAFFN